MFRKLLLIIACLSFTPYAMNAQSIYQYQQQMDLRARGEALIRNSYSKITKLKLTNRENINKYNYFINNETITLSVRKRVRRRIRSEKVTYKLFKEINSYLPTFDIGNYNAVRTLTSAFEEILEKPSIANEIKVVDRIQSEIANVKSNFPNNYYNKPRYTEMLNALSYLKSCKANEIGEMMHKFKLY